MVIHLLLSFLLTSRSEAFAPAFAHPAATASALFSVGEAQALMTLTVPLLKNRCRENGLKVGGTKADLVSRLAEMNEVAPSSDTASEVVATDAIAAAFSGLASGSPSAPNTHTYSRAKDDSLTISAPIDVINGLLADREAARLAKNFMLSDAIRDTLEMEYKVRKVILTRGRTTCACAYSSYQVVFVCRYAFRTRKRHGGSVPPLRRLQATTMPEQWTAPWP